MTGASVGGSAKENKRQVNVEQLTEKELELDDIAIDAAVATDASIDKEVVLLEPPTQALQAFEPFIKWLLSSPIEEITSIHKTLPFELTAPFTKPKETEPPSSSNRRERFESRAQAELARAAVEADCEAVADELSIARRERGGIEETVGDLHDEREVNRERIALLESRIVKHLQDRDLAIAEKYTTEKQIADIEAWKAQHPERRQSSLLGFLKKTEKRGSAVMYTNKDIEKLQKDIADTKMETALAKTELDTHYYRLRQLEKKCVALKLEIAQASALEDDLQASLGQLRKERRSSLDKLKQVSAYTAKQASPRGKTSPNKKGAASPRRATWLHSPS